MIKSMLVVGDQDVHLGYLASRSSTRRELAFLGKFEVRFCLTST